MTNLLRYPIIIKINWTACLIFVLSLVNSKDGSTYPDFIRKGYSSCLSCHQSIVGGDLLNEYGRQVAKEVFGSKSVLDSEREEKIVDFSWAINTRLLQTLQDNSQVTRGRFLIMQTDLDVVIAYREFKSYFSIGRYEPKSNQTNWNSFHYFPRIWLAYNFDLDSIESKIGFRYGRFLPNFGINFSEHTLITRSLNKLGPSLETKNLELVFTNDLIEFTLNKILARFSYREEISESGILGNFSFFIAEKTKLGIYKLETSSDGSRVNSREGIFILNSPSDLLSVGFELDRDYPTNGKTSIIALLRAEYEFTSKSIAIGSIEYANPDNEKTDPKFEAIGLGSRYHWNADIDFTGTIRIDRNTGNSEEFQKSLWMIFHWNYY